MNKISPIKEVVKLNDYFYEVHCVSGYVAQISISNGIIMIENDRFLSKKVKRLIELSVLNYGK